MCVILHPNSTLTGSGGKECGSATRYPVSRLLHSFGQIMLLQGQRGPQAVLQLASAYPEKVLFIFDFIKHKFYRY
jgi:hypothetical protein